MQQSIYNLNLKELTQFFQNDLQQSSFRANQIWDWLYQKGVTNPEEMTNLPNDLRLSIKDKIDFCLAQISNGLKSVDGTRKLLLKLHDGNEIETVYIPEKTRGTLCVSSQVGCTLNCKFCHTGTQPMVKNLSAGEIVQQVLVAKNLIADWPSRAVTKPVSAVPSYNNSIINRDETNVKQPNSTQTNSNGEFNTRLVTNIVFMGMGEPFLNYENVAKSVAILLDDKGLNFARKKITISTSGIVPQIYKCAEELRVRLAISLHAVNDELRDYLVPINKRYPIKDLLAACSDYAEKTNSDRITFEYVMLNQVNDSDAEAHELVRLLRSIPAKINLIPFNFWPGAKFTCSSPERIKRFAQIVEEAGYIAPIRTPRGDDILAACGQLRSDSVKIPKFQCQNN